MPAEPEPGAQELTFEQALVRLQEINDRFEEGELTLDEAVKLYQEGVRLAQACEEQLAKAEQIVRKVVEQATGEITETDFSPGQ